MIDVRWDERALARVAAHVARAAPGIERLDERPAARVPGLPRALFGQGTAAGGAVTVSYARDGSVEVTVRAVSLLRPAPVRIARGVGAAVSAELTRITGVEVRVEIAVTDVAVDRGAAR